MRFRHSSTDATMRLRSGNLYHLPSNLREVFLTYTRELTRVPKSGSRYDALFTAEKHIKDAIQHAPNLRKIRLYENVITLKSDFYAQDMASFSKALILTSPVRVARSKIPFEGARRIVDLILVLSTFNPANRFHKPGLQMKTPDVQAKTLRNVISFPNSRLMDGNSIMFGTGDNESVLKAFWPQQDDTRLGNLITKEGYQAKVYDDYLSADLIYQLIGLSNKNLGNVKFKSVQGCSIDWFDWVLAMCPGIDMFCYLPTFIYCTTRPVSISRPTGVPPIQPNMTICTAHFKVQ
ncbi:hypothetical protein BDB00DRAFT_880055 [Zychaea mexicana]|uniref:uncharacterized protein n=1 Tax=Zychaea mexicana TaxID=64656 RepID=UPI0022FE0113|nr:uncharacterized protein BDB00DRAFT_880055 [Zychaea mexicana]KAI9471375.1 hypothetical protein BDB00DRAFT_880055 [Zychaea mexicana]